MTKIMSPSAQQEMTDGQIEKAVDAYRAMLRKHRSELGSSEAAQQVLTQADYLGEQVGVLRRRVEEISNLIVRCWKADRTRSSAEVIKATGRNLVVVDEVIATMPRGKGEEGETIFFKLDLSDRGGVISDDDLEKEYALRVLAPEYPDNLAAINEADPDFANEHPNGTHWRANGKWCFAAFRRWCDARVVRVRRSVSGWGDFWWFAGLRK